MINNFSVFCLYMYVLVDDVMAQIRLLLKRRSSEPQCSDSELITISPGTRLKRRLGGTWARFGKVSSKKATIFGYKLRCWGIQLNATFGTFNGILRKNNVLGQWEP